MVSVSNQFRDAAHERMLDAALDAAADEVISRGWNGLRMSAIAERIGVSRQTLYNTFAGKHGIAQALVMRHNNRFLAGVDREISAHREPRAQWVAAVRYTLDTAAARPLFKAILTAESSEAFLPLITTDGAPIVVTARRHLCKTFSALHPDLDPEDLEFAAETVIRLTLSHILLPLHPTERVAERIADLATRFLYARCPASS